jgi:hypothetical protein
MTISKYHKQLTVNLLEEFLAGNSMNWIADTRQITISEVEQIIREVMKNGTR